jgi:hypothetical protein
MCSERLLPAANQLGGRIGHLADFGSAYRSFVAVGGRR